MTTRRHVNVEDLKPGDFTFLYGYRAITDVKLMPRAKRAIIKHGTDVPAHTAPFGDTLLVYTGMPS
jgi:hypothetical protein